MQKIFRTPALLALAFVVMLSSCSKTNTQGKLVPKDAAFVLHINGQSLSAKLPWEEIKKNELFKKMYADSTVPAFIKTALDNPDNSGIDIKNDLVFFAERDSTGAYMALEGTVKDAEKFRTFNLDASKGGSESEKDGIKMISHAPGSVGWNKDKFVYVFDAPEMNQHNSYSFADDTTGVKPKPRDLSATCSSIFSLKEDNSLGSDEKFTALMKKTGDVHLYANTEQLYKEGMSGAMSMMKLDKFYEGNIMTATANFENGKINVEYKTYLGKDMSAIFKKYSGGSIDETMLKNIPSKDVALAFALHFKPEGIKALIELSGMEGLINIGLMTVGFSVDDFIKANKGDILVALTDLKASHDTSITHPDGSVERRGETFHVQPDFLFSASIGDKDAFNQLIKAGKKMSKQGMMSSDSSDIAFNTNDKYFAIGSSKALVDKYLAGNSNSNADYISHLSGNPLGAYINLQYILKAMQAEAGKDSIEKIVHEASLKVWDNVYIKGGDYDDGGISYTIEINMMDKSTNSLQQLNQYLGLVGKLMEERKKTEQADTKRMDEIFDNKKMTVPPPPPPPTKKKNR